MLIFRQLFDPQSSTYTYLLGDNESRQAVLIDSVFDQVRRDAALTAGGFDENFIGAAYHFETEFCRRLTRHNGKIVFDPEASVHHLKAKSGGIRVYGDGVRGSRIEHSVGNYYFAFLESSGLEFFSYLFHAITSTSLSKYYACRPW